MCNQNIGPIAYKTKNLEDHESTAEECPRLLLGEGRIRMLGLLYRCLECLAASVMSQQQSDNNIFTYQPEMLAL